MAKFQHATEVFTHHNGILRTSEALDYGIAAPTLYEMRDQGVITELSRGLYQLTDHDLSDPDLVIIAKLVPQAVISLISALHYYNLTTQIPHYVYIALPQHIKKPHIDYPPIEVVWLSEDVYEAGQLTIKVDDIDVKIYDVEKTICDSFKFRNKYGSDVALEALKTYLERPGWDIGKLMHYAKVDRVESVITPYLEALL